MTTRELIAASLRKLGVIAVGETVNANDEAICLEALNAWLDAANANRLTLYAIARNVHDLVADQAAYTIGSGADFDQFRPTEIDSASVILDPTADEPVEVPIGRPLTRDEYQRLAVKSLSSTYPSHYYYNQDVNASGFGTVTLYPVPDSSTPDFVIYAPKHLTEVTAANIASTLVLPPGYRRMLIYNLAQEVAADFEKAVTAEIATIAAESKADVQIANFKPSELKFPRLMGRRFNIYTGA